MQVLQVFIVLLYCLCHQPSVGFYLQHGTVGGGRISDVWPELKSSEALSGELYQARIASSNLSYFGIQFLISKVGSPYLPKWLSYEGNGFKLQGLPLDSDTGVHELFILAMKYNESARTTDFLGAQNFKIKVSSRENRVYCQQGKLIVFANFLLMVNATRLNSTERVELYRDFTRTFRLSQTSDVFLEEQREIRNISTGSCKVTSETKVSSRNYSDPILGIWVIECSLNNKWNNTWNDTWNNTWSDTINNIANISSELGGTLAGFPLIRWSILNSIDGGRCLSYIPNTHTSSIVSSVYHSGPSAAGSSLFKGTSPLYSLSLSEVSYESTSVVSSTSQTKLLPSTASTLLAQGKSSSSLRRLSEVTNISFSVVSSTLHTKLFPNTNSTLFTQGKSSSSLLRLSGMSYMFSSVVSSTLSAKLLLSTAGTSLTDDITASSSLLRLSHGSYISSSVVSTTLSTSTTLLPSMSSTSLAQGKFSSSLLRLSEVSYISSSVVSSSLSRNLLPSTTSASLAHAITTSSSSLVRLSHGSYISSSVFSSILHTELSDSSLKSSRVMDKSKIKRSSSVVLPTQTLITMTTRTPTISQNSHPIVNHALPTLNITSCEYMFIEIPDDTFLDKEDGGTRNLTLRLLSKDFQEIPSDSWISLDPSRNVIYGVPLTTQVLKYSKHEYVLLAVDSGGSNVSTTLTIILVDEPHFIGQRISVEVDAYLKPSSLSPLELIKGISGYLYDGDKASMEILNLTHTNGNPSRVHMTWSDCKAIREICDAARVERISRLISVHSIINPQFMIALMPMFVLRDVQEERLGMCLNKPPLPTRNELLLNITCCEKFQLQIPPDLFTDDEDGNSRNLSLSLRYPNGSRLSSDSWIELNDTSKTIKGVISFEHAQILPASIAREFIMVAMDSGKLKTNVSVRIIIQHPLPSSNYHVTLILKRIGARYLLWLQEVCLIIVKLMSYFGDKKSGNVRVLSYRQQDLVTIFSWTNASLPYKPCDSAAIANISAQLKLENGQVRSDFKEAMHPHYEVQFVFEEKLGHCKDGANEPPKLLRPVLWLRLNGSFSYFEMKIPVDTFHDLEDGYTRNLKLSLLSMSFRPISKNSWIILNPEKQVLYGLPNEDANQAQPADGFRYLLVAQDSGGKVASSSLRVEIPRNIQPYNYLITARVRSYLDASVPCVDHVVKFLRNIITLTGEEEDSLRVMSYNMSNAYPADVSISWTNRSASIDTCDLEAIAENFRDFSDTESRASPRFSDVLLPHFIVQKITLKLYGACTKFPNHPPIVLSPVPRLNISPYRILEFLLPEKMFFDQEDGFTRHLTVHVVAKNGQTFSSSSWLAFNTSSQLLYGVPTRTVAKRQPADGYLITVVAMDTDGGTVNTTALIKIQKSMGTNYEMKVMSVVNGTREALIVDLVIKFFSKLKVYWKNRQELLLIDYTKHNSTLEVTFSSVGFLGIHCDFSEMQTLRQHFVSQNYQRNDNVTKSHGDGPSNDSFSDTRPSYNFTKEMAPDFVVMEITEIKKGPCSNTAPVLFQPLPFFLVSSYGLFSHPLPPNTFYDAEDGFTKNLSIFLLSSSGRPLSPDSWIQFNQTSLALHGIVTDQVILEIPEGNYSFLLLAEDVYGVKTNTSFLIDVPHLPLDVGLKLSMILRSNFSSIIPHVNIVMRIVSKMVTYFEDDNFSFIDIISFERGSGIPSTDIFTWSNTTLDSKMCNLEMARHISERARQSDNQPTPAFKEVFQPEFEILKVFEQRLRSCEDRQNSAPQVLIPLLTLNISRIPAVFRYRIPGNVFHDREDGDARALTLSLLGIDNQAISLNSSVQFNVPMQVIYGIFTTRDLILENRVKRFIVFATDSGGKTASTILRIFLENQTVSRNYHVSVIFNSYLSSSLADVAHLINFQEKLQTFPALRDTRLASHARASGYPARFVASFINASSLHIVSNSCDFDEITRISELFRDAGNNLREEFVRRFLPEFVLDEISIQRFGSCQVLRNEFPKVNERIPVINISVCRILKYKIPSVTFSDKEDGDTRNMTLELQNQTNSSWITLDVPSQTLYGIPTVDIARHQAPSGYQVKLIAVDSHGAIGETIVTIFVRDDVMVDSYRMTVSARIPRIFRYSKHIVQKAIEFAEAIQRYLRATVSDDMRIIRFDKMTPSALKVTWSNCSHGYTPCDYEKIESLRDVTIYGKGLPQPKFIQSLAPMFILESVLEEMRGPCLNKGPVTNRKLNPLTAKLCERLEYGIPVDTFYDSEDGYTSNLSLSLLHSNGKPLGQDFWIFFNTSSQTIIGYPNVDAANLQPESGYEFLLNARDRNGLSTNSRIRVIYEGRVPHSTFEVTFVLRAQLTLHSSVKELRIIIQKLTTYLGSKKTSIQVHSFVRARPNSTVSFLTWSNCSFPSNSCNVRGIAETSKRYKDLNGGILETFKEIFLPEFELQFLFEQRLGACQQDSNFAPKATQNLRPLILGNGCGIWEYSIPSQLFYDEEEGYTRNLTLSIKTNYFREVSAASWIQLDERKQKLYGFPELRNPRNTSSDVLVLLATDSKGKFGTVSLEIIFKTKIPNSHYQITVEMLSYLGESSEDVDHLRRFLEKLASFLNVDSGTLRVISYVRTILESGGSSFTVTWTNCSGRGNSCDHEQIQQQFSKINFAEADVNTRFPRAMLPYFVPTRVTLTKIGPCSQTNPSPHVLRPIGSISAFSGTLLWHKISENTFVDDEDGSTSTLSLMLQFSNKTTIPSDYWLKFDDVQHVIYGVSERPRNATFRLVARDRHGNEGFDVFKVFVERKCSEAQLNYKVNMEVEFLGNMDSARIGFIRKLESYFQPWITDRNFTLVSMNKMAETNVFTIIWSHTATCERCDQINSTIQALSRRITHHNGTTRVEFTNSLAPEFKLVNISETRCSVTKFGVTVLKGGKDDRWLLYIVPIATIASFLLFCFVFFIFRGFVSNYKRFDEVIVDEQPSLASSSPRDIHVNRFHSLEAPLSNSERISFVEEEFLENAYVNVAPEILLDKRISPSKISLRKDLSPISADDIETRVVKTPPLYTEAVLQLAPMEPGKRVPSTTTRIEMTEFPVVAKSEIPVLSNGLPVTRQASPRTSDVDGKRNSPARDAYSSPYPTRQEKKKERIQVARSLSLESDSLDVYGEDDWSLFDEEEYEVPVRTSLRLPTTPDRGMLRLPPVPKSLGNSPASSLLSTPEHESRLSSPFQTPLFTSTPIYSLSTTETTYDVRQHRTPDPSVGFPRTGPYEQPRIQEYPVGIPLQAVSPAANNSTVMGDRTNHGVQSPWFPPPYNELVPYVNHGSRNHNPVPPTVGANPRSPNDIHQVLGELRESVNRELDRRDEVDKYLELYVNKR